MGFQERVRSMFPETWDAIFGATTTAEQPQEEPQTLMLRAPQLRVVDPSDSPSQEATQASSPNIKKEKKPNLPPGFRRQGEGELMYYSCHFRELAILAKVTDVYFEDKAKGGDGWSIDTVLAYYIDPGSGRTFMLVRCATGPRSFVRVLWAEDKEHPINIPELQVWGWKPPRKN